jgi:hypothetical protein
LGGGGEQRGRQIDASLGGERTVKPDYAQWKLQSKLSHKFKLENTSIHSKNITNKLPTEQLQSQPRNSPETFSLPSLQANIFKILILFVLKLSKLRKLHELGLVQQ